MDILESLNGIFRQVFDDDTLDILPDMTANDIDDWDSLTQMNLMVVVEEKFNVRFDQSEISSIKRVGNIIDLLNAKII